MSKPPSDVYSPLQDAHAASRLVLDATLHVSGIAQALHLRILRSLSPLPIAPLRSGTMLAYRSVQGVARGSAALAQGILRGLQPYFAKQVSGPKREAMLAALNGVLGDYLQSSANPLTTPMQLRYQGQVWQAGMNMPAKVGGKIIIMLHGLCMNDLQWQYPAQMDDQDGQPIQSENQAQDFGQQLASTLGQEVLYLRYNSGLHISENGQALAELLQTVYQHWPSKITQISFIGHSMGGLLARSACHYGNAMPWRKKLKRMIFLGSPHHGAPLEKIGNWFHILTEISSFSAPFSSLGKLRSSGITDLRYGNLCHEDWQDSDRFAHQTDPRHVIPLPTDVACYTLAASIAQPVPGVLRKLQHQTIGDGLVPLASALGQHSNPEHSLNFPESHVRHLESLNHLQLLHDPQVYAQLLAWMRAKV